MIWLKKSALDYIVDSSLSPLSCLVVVEKIEKHRDEKWTIKGTQACAFISSQRSLSRPVASYCKQAFDEGSYYMTQSVVAALQAVARNIVLSRLC